MKPATLENLERNRANEPEAVNAWRKRMATDDAKMIIKKRDGIERVNAQMKRRELARVTVRGLAKVRAVALLQAPANNITT